VDRVLDWLVPLPALRDQIPDAKNFRSTWITASQATIRGRGLGERYEAALDPTHRDALLVVVPGMWLPMALARAHYKACDSLGLDETTMVDIGRLAMQKAHATSLSFITRMAKGAGVTPWTVLGQMPRLMAATIDDGAVGVGRLGPKDAHIEVHGYPLADIRYNRVTMRGIMLGAVELFCRRAFAKEIPELCDRRTIGLRLSWA
jgi:hypothetical protein